MPLVFIERPLRRDHCCNRPIERKVNGTPNNEVKARSPLRGRPSCTLMMFDVPLPRALGAEIGARIFVSAVFGNCGWELVVVLSIRSRDGVTVVGVAGLLGRVRRLIPDPTPPLSPSTSLAVGSGLLGGLGLATRLGLSLSLPSARARL